MWWIRRGFFKGSAAVGDYGLRPGLGLAEQVLDKFGAMSKLAAPESTYPFFLRKEGAVHELTAEDVKTPAFNDVVRRDTVWLDKASVREAAQ
jgi:hypothetical protein